MTKIGDIKSTTKTTKTEQGRVIRTVRDSLIVEILLSLIMALTILSCVTIVNFYVEIIEVSMFPPFAFLLLAIAHTFLRRLGINNFFLIIISHLMVSGVFFLLIINVPAFEYGNSIANKFYFTIPGSIVVLVGAKSEAEGDDIRCQRDIGRILVDCIERTVVIGLR